MSGLLPEPNCGNPLFLRWVREWRTEVGSTNRNYAFTLRKAIESLSNYPLPLTAKDTVKLNGIGPKIAQRLQEKLEEYQRERGIVPPTIGITEKDHIGESNTNTNNPEAKTKRTRKRNGTVKKREYVPRHRSGGFAILLGLKELQRSHGSLGYTMTFTKEEVINSGQAYSDTPLDRPLPGSQYSAWSSLKVLLAHELIYASGSPAKYSLSDLGRDLAQRLSRANDALLNIDQPNPEPKSPSPPPLIITQNLPPLINRAEWSLISGNYEICLILDNREIRDRSTERTYLQDQLQRRGISTLTRSLSLGDFLWIARPLQGSGGTHEELLLDFIIERKTMDDLAASIRDGRFREQKSRLTSCGVPHVTYLVEGFNPRLPNSSGVPPQALWTGLTHTLIDQGFHVKFTSSLDDTLDYLARVTRQLITIYQGKDLKGLHDENITRHQLAELQSNANTRITFSTFQNINSKSSHLTLSELFVRMLVTCRGMSVLKAKQVIKKYPTPASLIAAYRAALPSQRDRVLHLPNHVQSRSISLSLSKRLYQVWQPNLPSS